MKRIAFLFPLLVSQALFAQSTTDIKNVKTYYRRLASEQELNGAVLVAQKGTIIFQQASGLADFEQHRLNRINTGFEIASITKTFTAIAVLQLFEKSKLSLDDKYVNYFPAFPYRDITLRQMLSHTSGLSDQDLNPAIHGYEVKHPKQTIRNNDLITILKDAKVKLHLQPGEKWWYSNIGYNLLALLVEKLSKENFKGYLKRHIFKPAGMDHSYVRMRSSNPAIVPFAENYDYPATFDTTRVKMAGKVGYYTNDITGNSNVFSTVGDMFLYDRALHAGKLLKPATLESAMAPAKLNNGEPDAVWLDLGGMGKADNGLGWFIFEDQSMGKIVWHTGGMPGCATIFLRNVTKDQMVILLDNTNSEKLYQKGLNALRLLNGKPPLIIRKSLTKLYGKTLFSKGADGADRLLRRLIKDTLHYVLSENDMNNLGYAFLEHKHLTHALVTLKLNTELYPESDNVYNSYGDALNQSGAVPEAISMYKKSLSINPKNEDSINALKLLDKP